MNNGKGYQPNKEIKIVPLKELKPSRTAILHPSAVKEIPEDGLDDLCKCGHAKGNHAQFIDNQTNSTSYKPERRHCLHLGGDGAYKLDNVCPCNHFAAGDRSMIPVLVEAVVSAMMPMALQEVADELARARAAYPNMRIPHEGYAVILEEVDELWDLIKQKQTKHDRAAMRREAMQVAAMAIRFMEDLCGEGEKNVENKNTIA